MSKHTGDYPRDVYPDRRKAAERRERDRGESDRRTAAREIVPTEAERFAGAFGLHASTGPFRTPPRADEIVIEIVKAPITIVPFSATTSSYTGRTARGRARRS